MWSGSVTDIPEGWLLCDGQNGTLDLTDKFIVGAGKTYSPGATGGEAEVILTTQQIPSHSHSLKTIQGSGSTIVSNYSANSSMNTGSAINTNSSGGGQPHNNLPPYYALCFIVKQ